MARRIITNCFLACLAVFLFVTFVAYFQSLPDESIGRDVYITPDSSNDESLQGAVEQSPGKSIPAPYQVADPILPPKFTIKPVDYTAPQPAPGLYDGIDTKSLDTELEKVLQATPAAVPVYLSYPIGVPEGVKTAISHPVGSETSAPKTPATFNVPDDLVYDPAGPKPSQVVILSASDGKGHNHGIENLMEMTRENRQEYAEYHGFQNIFINISKYDIGDAHPVWAKLPAIVEAFNQFPDAQYVWWLDMDAIIMSPEVSISEHLLSQKGLDKNILRGHEFVHTEKQGTGRFMTSDVKFSDIDIILGQDHNGLNAGSFILRRSKFTQMLLDIWADPFFMKNDWPGKEQDTLMHLMRNHQIVRDHLALVGQRTLNAYPVGWIEMGWRPGDLVIHLAGCWVDDQCNARWQDSWNRRTTVQELKANNGVPRWREEEAKSLAAASASALTADGRMSPVTAAPPYAEFAHPTASTKQL